MLKVMIDLIIRIEKFLRSLQMNLLVIIGFYIGIQLAQLQQPRQLIQMAMERLQLR